MGLNVGKPVTCPTCGLRLKSGKALGGHLTRHWSPKKRAAVKAKKNRHRVSKAAHQEPGPRVSYDARRSRWTADFSDAKSHAPAKTPKRETRTGFSKDSMVELMKKAAASDRLNADATAGPFDGTSNQIVLKLRQEAKSKRDVASKLEAKTTELREAANEIDRLAERLERIL